MSLMNQYAKIDVGGYRLAYQRMGRGQPTVVFECGSGDSAVSLANLAHTVQHFTTAVIYDRAGLGESDPAPRPRTLQDAVADLHTLLHAAQVPGPYVLVGHSLGGLIVRLFAHIYQAEVAGLVLLDIPHPEQALRELQHIPPPSPDEPAVLTAFREQMIAEWNDPFRNDEGFDLAASAAQLRAAGHLGDVPLVVITAGIDEWEDGFPPEIARALAADWLDAQRELAALSTHSTHILATESNHAIQDCQPDLVVDAIRNLVMTIRG
jgi:pimeloyl-ACP methyl ester carboxylesterase